MYNVFVSHSWSHSEDLIRLREHLEAYKYFKVEFEEVTKHDPIDSINAPYVKRCLRERIRQSDVLLVIAGVYASYSEWMVWEMDTARKEGIPVIGVIPWGQERVSAEVRCRSYEDVRWNTESIVNAIRKWAK